MTVLTSLAIGFVLSLIFLFLRGSLAFIFTQSEEVAKAVSDLSSLLAFSLLLNSVHQLISGIPVGLALGILLSMQVKGVWIGMLFGTFVQTVVILTWKTDWDKQVTLARNLANKWLVRDVE
ncbi:hypothetical protein FEM48_Zijuj12G0166600 [Ziziphus jujuba var. spinosa]|uniref:Uncharacterized protein n=1 Tax=Ziziphus jujuba var. spinosa TaxID=714518 RepID=A0A978UEG2_ZIZJJ|nr:hypothetical protein FEM48_Zijuj12G0166600 [Ziziphus jujuba var. spinosa]